MASKQRRTKTAKALRADASLRIVKTNSDLSEQPITPLGAKPRRDSKAKARGAAGANKKRRAKTAKPVTRSRVTSSTSTDNGQRLANGFKIVSNSNASNDASIPHIEIRAKTPDEVLYKQLFTRFEAAFLAADIDAIASCLSPAFQWHLPNGMVVYGKAEALDEMQRRFAMPNGPKFSNSVWRFNDTTVIQTYNVSYCGPDGKWRDSLGMDLYEIGDGLIARKDAYWKMIP